MGKHSAPSDPGAQFDAQFNHSANTAAQNGVPALPEGQHVSGEGVTPTDGSGPVTHVSGGNGK